MTGRFRRLRRLRESHENGDLYDDLQQIVVEGNTAIRLVRSIIKRVFRRESDIIKLNLRETELEKEEREREQRMKESIKKQVLEEVYEELEMRRQFGESANDLESVVDEIISKEMAELREIRAEKRQVIRKRKALLDEQSAAIRELLEQVVELGEPMTNFIEEHEDEMPRRIVALADERKRELEEIRRLL